MVWLRSPLLRLLVHGAFRGNFVDRVSGVFHRCCYCLGLLSTVVSFGCVELTSLAFRVAHTVVQWRITHGGLASLTFVATSRSRCVSG